MKYIAETSSPTITTDPTPTRSHSTITFLRFNFWNLVLVFTRRPRTSAHASLSLVINFIWSILCLHSSLTLRLLSLDSSKVCHLYSLSYWPSSFSYGTTYFLYSRTPLQLASCALYSSQPSQASSNYYHQAREQVQSSCSLTLENVPLVPRL